jgi:hypothetical protein
LVDYRCQRCDRVYNLYSATVFAGSGLSPRQVVLLLRGVCKGESSAALAEELRLSRTTVHYLRQKLQANADACLNQSAVPDQETETDEMFPQRGGKKGRRIAIPMTLRRRHANKRRGHGTYANDRPPVVGTFGRPQRAAAACACMPRLMDGP